MLDSIYKNVSTTINLNPKKRHGKQIILNSELPNNNNDDLNSTTLKCLGIAGITLVSIYAGAKGVKYLKNRKFISPHFTEGKSNFNIDKPPVHTISTFKGMSASQIIQAYKSGDKTVYKELAKVAHPDSKNYNKAYRDLFLSITIAIRKK